MERPDTRRGLAAVARLAAEQDAERVLVGLPLTLAGEEGAQAAEARAFAERLERRLRVPVELYDERLTTRQAERSGGRGRPRLARRRAPPRGLPRAYLGRAGASDGAARPRCRAGALPRSARPPGASVRPARGRRGGPPPPATPAAPLPNPTGWTAARRLTDGGAGNGAATLPGDGPGRRRARRTALGPPRGGARGRPGGVARGVVPHLAVPAVQGRRRRAGAGHHPARLEPRADRHAPREKGVVSSSTFFQLRARLAGRSDGLKPGRYTLREGHELHRRAGRAREGHLPQHRGAHHPGGTVARRRSRGSQRAGCPAATSRPPAARGCSTRASTGPRAPRASRASSSRPPTSSGAGSRCGAWWIASSPPSSSASATVSLRKARSKNLTPWDVLIIASMVEREAQVPQRAAADRLGDLQPAPRGHSAGHRRHPALRDGQLGPAAAGVAAPGRHAVQHPRHLGPPAGPDRQPGPRLDPAAAANPAQTKYLFYVVKPCGRGQHAFAATDAQHQRNVDAYNRARAKSGGNSPVELLMPLAGLGATRSGTAARPTMMNAAFAELGLDWQYVKLPGAARVCSPPRSGAARLRATAGANVTIPHKLAAPTLADEVSDAVAAIGAVNTLAFAGGRHRGRQTDAGGLVDALAGSRAAPRSWSWAPAARARAGGLGAARGGRRGGGREPHGRAGGGAGGEMGVATPSIPCRPTCW